MNVSQPLAAAWTLAARRGGDRGGRTRDGGHMTWLHDWFANDPWIAWPVTILVGILLVFVLIGRLIFKAVGAVPWWARLGLLGAGVMWWRRRNRAPMGTGDPAQWVDLSQYRPRE